MARLSVLFLAALMLAAPLAAQELKKGEIVFAVDPSWPPMEYIDDNKQIVGYSVDYFTAVCRESGLTAKFQKADWDDIFDRLDKGDFDAVMSSVSILPERRARMDFTVPYYIVRQGLVTRPDSKLGSIRQIKGRKVGTQAETTASEMVDKSNGAISVTYKTMEEAFEALIKGELDAALCEDVVATDFLSRPEYAGKIKLAALVNTPGAEELYGVAVRKNNLPVLVALNDGIKAVRAKGIEAELRRKWFKTNN